MTASKTLKEQNRIQLWLIIALNLLFLCTTVQAGAVRTLGLQALFKDATNLLPAGIALILATVLNGVLSADMKARLVFWRWRDTLPGHRAFSKHGPADPRVDMSLIEKTYGPLPAVPAEQNRLWFRMYKQVENAPGVLLVHKDFLLTRDYTGLAFLFLLLLSPVAAYLIANNLTRLAYAGLLTAQYFIARQAAHTYGVRMVTTVLSQTVPALPKKRGAKKTT